MNKRQLLTIAVGAAIMGHAAYPRAQASWKNVRHVGVFTPGMPEHDEVLNKPFYDEMRVLGWVEGKNIAYDRIHGSDRMEILPRLAAELVARKPDLIFTASPPTSKAARDATSTIPVVFTAVVDPVASGLVSSLASPGGNVTGVTQSVVESLAPKRLQILREVLPSAKRIGLLSNPGDPGSIADELALAPLLRARGMTMVVAKASNPADFEQSVGTLLSEHVHVVFAASSIAITRRDRLIELTSDARIPVVGLNLPMARAGALFSYGASLADQIKRAAHIVDKVLRGAKPADIPIEAANVLEFVINLRSAKALGINIPQSVLLSADTVIE